MSNTAPARSGFDRIARLYRWLEYTTLGRSLERCRLRFLSELANRTHALVLGDGDGRFLAQLLTQDPALRADAVDTSAAMLKRLEARCEQTATDLHGRLRTHQMDALTFVSTPSSEKYDLVVTHFFLDCLSQHEVEALAAAIAPQLSPDALWVVSEFSIPPGAMRIPSQLLVRSLYRAFRILTGLRANRLPDYARALTRAGLIRAAHQRSLAGVLISEFWVVDQFAGASPAKLCFSKTNSLAG